MWLFNMLLECRLQRALDIMCCVVACIPGAAAVSLFADESDSDLGISEIPVKQVCVAAASDVCSDNDGSSRLSMTGELTGSEGVNDKTLTPGSEPFRIFRRSGSSLADEGCDMLRGETLPKIGDDDGLIAERKSESDGSRKGSSGSAAAKRPVFYAGDAFSDVEPSDDPCTDVEPSDSDFDGTGRVRVDEQRRSDSKQSTRLLEELSWSPEPTSAADMRQPSDGNESAALGNGGTSPESVLGSRAHFVGRDENAEEDGVLDLHYFDREPLLLMDEGNNTMDRLFGLVSDSDAESPGKAAAPAAARDPSPPRVVVALQPRPSACDIEDGEVTDSDTEHVQSSGRRGGDYDGRQKDGNFTANRVRKLPAKRSTVGSSPSDERKPDKPERHRTKHVDQSATEWRQKSSDVVRRHHSHSDNEHGNDRHPDARRDRKPSRDNERRERQTSLSRKAQSVGGSSRGGNSHGDQRSPLRTRTAENVHRSSVEDRTVTEYAAGSKRKGNVKSGRKKNKNNNRK